MGHNWLEKILLNWNGTSIHKVNADQLQAVLTQYSNVFKPELGTMRNFKAKRFVDPSVLPRFCKARLVQYAMKPLVEAELDKLVDQGILTPVQHADWAAPIVPIMKADRKIVRICGDFKQTVNKASTLDKYPHSEREMISLQVWQVELDMSQAYQQLCLDNDSKKCIVTNTSKGLFCYSRLPFGISSTPEIFQRVI